MPVSSQRKTRIRFNLQSKHLEYSRSCVVPSTVLNALSHVICIQHCNGTREFDWSLPKGLKVF